MTTSTKLVRTVIALITASLVLVGTFSAVAVADEPTASPPVSGRALVGHTLEAPATTWDPDTIPTFQWFADDAPIADAVTPTWTLTRAQIGKEVHVVISGMVDGAVTEVTSANTLRVALAGSPALRGDPVAGQVMSVAPGTWTNGTTFTYEWRTDTGRLVSRASKVRLPNDLRDRKLVVQVSGTKSGHTPFARTITTARRVIAPSKPRITGTLLVGRTLTSHGTSVWSSNTTFKRQWYADGRALPRATGKQLKLTSTTAGKQISVRLVGSQSGYPTAKSDSLRTLRVVSQAPTPRVTGKVAAGRTLTAVPGSWMRGIKLSYRWYANGTPIKGATRSTYRPSTSMLNKRITVKTTGRRTGFATITRTSASSAKVQRVGRASLSGSSKAGEILTAHPGTWTNGTRFTYAWYVERTKVSSARSVTVKSAWKGKRLRVNVTGRRSGYHSFSSTSGWTRAVSLPTSMVPSGWDCPSWAPIKGNADSGIYHVPGGAYYDRTNPEVCFSSETAAMDAGYRRSKR